MTGLGNLHTHGRLAFVNANPKMQLLEGAGDARAEELATLRAAGAGDEAAVRRLYRLYVDRVHRHVSRVLGPNDPDVEDVVQQVFLAALAGAEKFAGRSQLSTWLLGIASRRALDEARSRWRRHRWQKVTERVGLGRAESRPDERHAAIDEAYSALAELHPDQRTVFILHDVEGHTFAEIREMTGVGISTLHARLKAAKRKLDARVAGEHAEGGSHGAA